MQERALIGGAKDLMPTDTRTVKSMVSLRPAGRRSANLAGAIFGTIIATAVVAGLDEDNGVSAGGALAILLATGATFWAAHVYANLLAERIQGHRPTKRDDLRRVMSREWPLLQSTFPLAVPLALGGIGMLNEEAAFSLATFVGVIALVSWGVGLAHHEGYGVAGVVGAGIVNAAVGLFIIGLKVALG
jgi:hypothetical protein